MGLRQFVFAALLPAVLAIGCSDDDDAAATSSVSSALPAAVRSIVPELEDAMRSGTEYLPPALTEGVVRNPLFGDPGSDTWNVAVDGNGAHAGTVATAKVVIRRGSGMDGSRTGSYTAVDADDETRRFLRFEYRLDTPTIHWQPLPYGTTELLDGTGHGQVYVQVKVAAGGSGERLFVNDPVSSTSSGTFVTFDSTVPDVPDGTETLKHRYRETYVLGFIVDADGARLNTWGSLSQNTVTEGVEAVTDREATVSVAPDTALDTDAIARVLRIGADHGSSLTGTEDIILTGSVSGGVTGGISSNNDWSRTVLGSSWLPRQSSTWQPDDSFSVTWQLNDTTEVGDGQTQCGVVSINSASESDIAPAFVHPCGVHFYLYLPSEAAVEAPLILFW